MTLRNIFKVGSDRGRIAGSGRGVTGLDTLQLPKILAQEAAAAVTKNKEDQESPYHQNYSNKSLPKGCYCQMGSIIKSVLLLIIIIASATGFIFWIYDHHMAESSLIQNLTQDVSKILFPPSSKSPLIWSSLPIANQSLSSSFINSVSKSMIKSKDNNDMSPSIIISLSMMPQSSISFNSSTKSFIKSSPILSSSLISSISYNTSTQSLLESSPILSSSLVSSISYNTSTESLIESSPILSSSLISSISYNTSKTQSYLESSPILSSSLILSLISSNFSTQSYLESSPVLGSSLIATSISSSSINSSIIPEKTKTILLESKEIVNITRAGILSSLAIVESTSKVGKKLFKPSSSTHTLIYPTIQTFTVGQDGRFPVSPTLGSKNFEGVISSELTESEKIGLENHNFITSTVTGFLDFITTVGNTVMIFTPQNGLKKSPVITTTWPSSSKIVVGPLFSKDVDPTIGIEGLFQNFERPSSGASVVIESSFDSLPAHSTIQPSSVIKSEDLLNHERVTSLSNGLIEVDGAIDNPIFDKASKEPAVEASETFKVINTANSGVTETSITSETITNNFHPDKDGNIKAVGLVTTDGGTLIVNGVTTVHSTRIFGTYGEGGKYAQILQTTSKIFQGDNEVGNVGDGGFVGSAIHVTERPKLGIEPLPSKQLSTSPATIQPTRSNLFRKNNAAIDDFKNRLKSRFQKFKQRVDGEERNRQTSSSKTVESKTSGFRKERNRFRDNIAASPSEQIEVVRPINSSPRTRNRFRNRDSDLEVQESLRSEDKVSAERNSFGSRKRKTRPNRFRSRFNNKKPSITTASPKTTSKPTKESKFNLKRPKLDISSPTTSVSPKRPVFKKFNRFSRPDVRSSLLQKILGKNKNISSPSTSSVSSTPTIKSLNQDYSEISDNEVEANLASTLQVSTIHPESLGSTLLLQVATIRSPYSFSYEDQMSTRYVTVTRTFTSTISPTSTLPSKTSKTSSPLFLTETIPAPVNILTSSLGPLLTLEGSIENLPPVTYLPSTIGPTPPLKTVTETFSTSELMLKTSILPVVSDGKTKLHTLIQTYFITRFVEAVKTIPPIEAYEFIPTKAFTDFSNVLDEAGSEKREQLLPGELEFSDQDEYNVEGPTEVRVKPPPGFTDDLKLIGSKFDPVDKMEKENNPGMAELKDKPSTISNNQEKNSPVPVPSPAPLFNPFNPFASFTPEQIQQLALLQYFGNPFGSTGLSPSFNNPVAPPAQIVTGSTPTLITETVYETNTLPIIMGNKKMFTTLTRSVGVTTKTKYETTTQSTKVNNPRVPGVTFNPFQQFAAAAAAVAGKNSNPEAALSGFTITSSPIIKETTIPSVVTKELRIIFRNAPTVTTLTSSTLIPTQVTEYVTQTVPVTGTSGNPFKSFLG